MLFSRNASKKSAGKQQGEKKNMKNEKKLDSFEFENKLVITFELDDEQFKMVQDNIDVYGHSRIGKSKTLKMLPNQKLWRRPLITSNHTTYLCWDDEPDSIES